VVIAEDVDPEEVVMHLPMICAEKNVPYCYVATKKELGASGGLGVPCASIAIEKAGNAAEIIKGIVEKIGSKAPKAEAKKEAAPVEKKEHAAKEVGHEKKSEAPAAAEEKKPAKEKKPRAKKEKAPEKKE
jgi:hypothetical protein